MNYFKTVSAGILGLLMLTATMMTFEAAAHAAAPLRGSASVAVKVKKSRQAPVKQVNPRVPYTFSSGGKAMIPLSLSDLLKAPSATLPESSDFVRRFSLHPTEPDAATVQFKTSAELLQEIQSNANLFQHMETLRQGYVTLPKHEQNDLLVRLLGRYETAPDNAVNYFDYGYAQLLYLDNQTGLFFLRKANEQLQNSATALAYAMGQAQVDLNQEKAKPEEMTMRKLDVIHKLSDAQALDLSAHQVGFWPFYMQTVQKLNQFPAYQGLARRDLSVSYVPVGDRVPYSQLHNYQAPAEIYGLTAMAADKAGKNKAKKSKDVPTPRTEPEQAIPKTTDPHVLGLKVLPGRDQVLKFQALDGTGQVKVTVLDAQQQHTLGEFLTQGSMDVVEDLNKDGQYELVVRQYRESPLDPVRVYRWTGQRYELDSNIAQFFQ